MALPTLSLVRTSTLAPSGRTLVPWTSAVRNTGPSSWWDSGTPTSIVAPWVGAYYIQFFCLFASDSGGNRFSFFVTGTDPDDIAARVAGFAAPSGTATESGGYQKWSLVLNVATAGQVYGAVVEESSGSQVDVVPAYSLLTGSSTTPACAGFDMVYLGSQPRTTQITQQAINRAALW